MGNVPRPHIEGVLGIDRGKAQLCSVLADSGLQHGPTHATLLVAPGGSEIALARAAWPSLLGDSRTPQAVF